jgi:CheY-like chemotaxis protein
LYIGVLLVNRDGIRAFLSLVDAFAGPRYGRLGAGESGRATVLASCLHGYRIAEVGAGLNASGGDLCDDRGVRPTVLIVDDHDGFRESAWALLEAEGFTVVGDAADGAAAIAEAGRLRPDVVLLDVQLPDVDGFVVAGRLAAGPDPPRVVLISSRDAAAYGPRVDAAPVSGFLAKRELSGAALAALVR